MNELQTAPIGTALWVYDWVDRRHCLAIKVAPGDADRMVRNVPAGRVRCRIFTVGSVPVVFLLFRFEGYDITFINAVNYCGEAEAGENQQSILKSLAAGAKLVFAVYENDEFVGGFESSPATTFWSGIIQALCDCPAWTQEEWDRAFRAFLLRRIPVDELWHTTPQVIGISSYEDLDEYEGILRQEGYGAWVDASQGVQKRHQFQELWKAPYPEVLLQAAVIALGNRTAEGQLVTGVAVAWFEILAQLERDPDFLFNIDWRKLEEIVAGAYERHGYKVELTPRSRDGGRDVIATLPGVVSIRIFDQIKAYRRGRM